MLALILSAYFIACSTGDGSSTLCSSGNHSVPNRQAIVLGIDGLRFDAVTDQHMPFLSALRQLPEAHWQLLDVSDGMRQRTYSAPSWVSLLTAQPAPEHHVYDNSRRRPVEAATLFERLQANNRQAGTLFATDWPQLYELLADRLAALPPGTSSVGVLVDDAAVESWFASNWAACQPTLSFVHLNEVDDAGHDATFDPSDADYAAALVATDERVKRMLENVWASDQGGDASGSRLVVVVSDHGGVGDHHGGFQREEREVPLLILAPAGTHLPVMQSLADVGTVVLEFLTSSERLDGSVSADDARK